MGRARSASAPPGSQLRAAAKSAMHEPRHPDALGAPALPKGRPGGFTMVELVVVLAIVCFLCAILAQGRGDARDGSQLLQCLNNQRQLIGAWQMYADENNGALIVNVAAESDMQGRARSWAAGWLDWSSLTDNTNVLLLIDDRYSRMARYLNRSPGSYHCPSDTYLSNVQRSRGWTRRARSYSMSAAVGNESAGFGPLDTAMYRPVRRITDFGNPAPRETWVFIEEHPDSINDSVFFPPQATSLLDVPATTHNVAATAAFADGHAEAHAWAGRQLNEVFNSVKYNISSTFAPPGDPDLRWLSYHSPRRTLASY